MATGTFTVAGHKVRTQSQRRYVVFAIEMATGRSSIVRRSDSIATARQARVNHDFDRSRYAVVVIDTATGEDVSIINRTTI